jgi:ATP-dependent DNA helicase RecG
MARYADGVEPQRRPLDEPLRRIQPRLAAKLEAMGLRTAGDLLRHYPRRYADPGTLTDISSLVVGETVSIVADVRSATVRYARKDGSPRVEAVITDGRRTLPLTFFVRKQYLVKSFLTSLRPGRRAMFTGQVTSFRGQAQLSHPRVDYFDAEDEGAEERLREEAGRPRPVYPATGDVDSAKIASTVRTVLDPLRDEDVDDPVPPQVRERRGLGPLHTALVEVHTPHDEADWQRGRDRLRYEEAFVLQAELARRRASAAAEPGTARPRTPGGLLDAFDARLPFALTAGQRDVGETIAGELASTTPMQRLLQGEVGSGKTVVALRAMLQVVDAGGQAALLAPTEVLAAQHARTLRTMLGDLAEGGMLGGADVATRVALLTGSLPAAQRRAALLDAASGAAGIVVGTHALLGDAVQFADLGLVVVDEQHRFGVEQRDRLRAKAATTPHLLVMTATPIPRTVAMTVFGDLETSVLAEVPAGRSPVVTHVVPADRSAWVDRMWQRVREEVDAGGRVYVVCARIDPDDKADGDGADLVAAEPTTLADVDAPARRPLRAVLDVVEELRRRPELAGVEVGMLTGAWLRRTRTGRWPTSRRGRRPCWSRRRSSRSASTCPRRPSCSCSTPTGSASRSCTSCAGGSGGGRSPACASSSRRRPRAPRRRPAWRRSPARPTGSRSRRWTSSCGARATCSAPRSRAGPRRCGCCGSPATATSSSGRATTRGRGSSRTRS